MKGFLVGLLTPIAIAAVIIGALAATGKLDGYSNAPGYAIDDDQVSPAIVGDVLAQFTIELTVAEGQPPPVNTNVKLYMTDGTPYADINSRFVWTEIPQYTEHVEAFRAANEGDTDVTIDAAIVDAPTWATVVVDPATALIFAGSQADFTWTLTIDGAAPVGAQAVVTVQFVEGG